MIFAIAEGNISKLHMAMHVLDLNCVWRILDLRLDFQDFHETLKACKSLLVLLNDFTEPLDRLNEVVDVEQEDDQVGKIDCGPSQDADPAKDDDGHNNQLAIADHALIGIGFV